MEAILSKYEDINKCNFRNLVHEMKDTLTPTDYGILNRNFTFIEWQLYESDGIDVFLLVKSDTFNFVDVIHLFIYLNGKLISSECQIMRDSVRSVRFVSNSYFRLTVDFKTFTTNFVKSNASRIEHIIPVYDATLEWIFSSTSIKSAR